MILLGAASIKAGSTDMAKRITDKLLKFVKDDLNYINSLSSDIRKFKQDDIQFSLTALNFLANEAKTNGMSDLGNSLEKEVQNMAKGLAF